MALETLIDRIVGNGANRVKVVGYDEGDGLATCARPAVQLEVLTVDAASPIGEVGERFWATYSDFCCTWDQAP